MLGLLPEPKGAGHWVLRTLKWLPTRAEIPGFQRLKKSRVVSLDARRAPEHPRQGKRQADFPASTQHSGCWSG